MQLTVGQRVGMWRVTGQGGAGEWICEAMTRSGQPGTFLDRHLKLANGMWGLVPDITGARFGLLTATAHSGGRDWTCVCECGWSGVKRWSRLVKAQTWRCGNVAHAQKNYELPEYHVWRAARARCLNPKDPGWSNYGGRGITMDPRWTASFEMFLLDVGRRPSPELTLERIDNDRGYEPGNMRWATRAEQAANRRPRRDTTIIEFDGFKLTIEQWAAKLGLTEKALRLRLGKYAWPLERALRTGKLATGRPLAREDH